MKSGLCRGFAAGLFALVAVCAGTLPGRVTAEPTSTTPLSLSELDYSDARPSAEDMLLDGLVVRPLALLGTMLGSAVYLVTLPFNVASGNTEYAAQRLINEPADYAFTRCFGCVSSSDSDY